MIIKHMKITWQEDYSVNVGLIDGQHKKFIGIINKLDEAVENNDTKEEIIHVLEDLTDYIEYHFLTEENFFDQFEYDKSNIHKEMHESFAKKVDELTEQFKNGKIGISKELSDFTMDWLINHIITIDKQYTKCFNDHGLQ